jgi:hypothetical protein
MDNDIAEASLAELVSDPLIRLLMKSDGVDRRTIEALFECLAQERPFDFCRMTPQEGAAA